MPPIPSTMDTTTRTESPEDYLSLLTDAEKEALTAFKTHNITDGFSDRRLMIYLWSRKLKVDRAVTLLTNNLEYREKMGIPRDIPKELLNEEIFNSRVSFFIPGTLDKQVRGINYLIPSRLIPSNYPLKDFFMQMMYLSDLSQWESPDYHRNGVVVVEDLKDAGFKHFDSRLTKKEKGKPSPMEDIFAGRVQAIYLLHAPIIIKPLLQLAKLIVKKKLISRIKIVSKKADMLQYVDKSQLHKIFGGDLENVPM